MKYRVNAFDKRIVSIWDLKKDIQINIYNKDTYHAIVSLYANSIIKYPLEITFYYDNGMPITIRPETFKNNLKFDHEGESTKYYKLHLK